MEKEEKDKENDMKILTEEEIEKIKDAFDVVDSRGRGKFDPKEFKENMESNGLHEKEPLIYEIFNELDTEEAEKNGVTFEQLIEAISNKLGNKNSREGTKKIFDLFVDKKGSNTITLHALKKAANEFGQKMTNEQLKELFEKASKNGNELTFDEFYNVINKKS